MDALAFAFCENVKDRILQACRVAEIAAKEEDQVPRRTCASWKADGGVIFGRKPRYHPQLLRDHEEACCE
jgi:hypothetical protein